MKVFTVPTVYLDLNHLIDLAKGRRDSDTCLYDRIRTLADAKKACFPFSFFQLLELLAIRNPRQKAAIFDIIKSISDKIIICDYLRVLHIEVKNAVADHFDLKSERLSLPLAAYWHGSYIEAMGNLKLGYSRGKAIDPEKSAEVEAIVTEYHKSDNALDNLIERAFLPKLGDNELVEQTESDRRRFRGKPLEEVERNLLVENSIEVRSAFYEVVDSLEIKRDGVRPTMPESFITSTFLATLPSYRCQIQLNLQLFYKDYNKSIFVNHLYDIGHLAVAIPYCDVVVCDKEMHHAIKSGAIDKIYKTAVFAKLSDAITYVETLVE